jgi:UPF0755 protein
MDFSRIKRAYYITALCLFFLFFFFAVSAPPKNFPSGTIVSVREGAGLFEVAHKLQADGVIRNAAWFRAIAVLFGGDRKLQSGDYYLPYPQSVYSMIERVLRGDHKITRVRITIPEGFTAKKIANLFDERFTLFDKKEFLKLAPEGYLFPDTYFIGVNATATSTIDMLKNNFDKRIFPYTGEIANSKRSFSDIIIMASIIESEANTTKDREIVSGILWKRLDQDLPLQVDASLTYLNGKTSAELTQNDLKFDSPYNTYINKGLPPKPISNPGLDAINAALHPAVTPFMFFLTGDDGKMYYAKTFDDHKQNIQKYIK